MYPIPGGDSVDRFPLMQPWEETPSEKGDVNGDGAVDMDDVYLLLNHVGDPAVHPIDPWTGDVNCDGTINMGDVILLLNHVNNPATYEIECCEGR